MYLFSTKRPHFGPFVYRLGHMVFIHERGVRFPQGPPLKSYFVYLIGTLSKDKYITYVGYTSDVKKRLSLHNNSKGAKFTRGRNWFLICKKKYASKKNALKEEYKFKKNYNLRKKFLNKYLKNEKVFNFQN